MGEPVAGLRAPMRIFAVVALALAGIAFSLTPVAERCDAALLDASWTLLRRFDPTPAADDIIIVGIDEASVAAIAEPAGLWHVPLARAVARIAAAGPRAIGLDF